MKNFVVDNNVHIKSNNSTSKMMKHFMIALIPIVFFVFYKNGLRLYLDGDTGFVEMLQPLLLVIAGMITAYLTEMLYASVILKRKKEELRLYLKHSFATIPGLLLALIVPSNIELSIFVLGVVAAVIFGKMIFGGFGKNIFNPALVGFVFLLIAFPSVFNGTDYMWASTNTQEAFLATPLNLLQQVDFVGSYNELMAPGTNLWDYFFGFDADTGARISIFLCLLGFIYLAYFKVIKIKIPIITIGTVFLMTMIIGYYNNMELWYPLFHILTGSLVFGAIYLATDSVTSPVTNFGQITYGILLGLLVVVLRYFTPFVDGIFIAILIMNGLVILIDKVGIKFRFDIYKALLMLLIPVGLVVGVTLYVSSMLDAASITVVDDKFEIVSKDSDDNFIYYVVRENNSSVIEAKITMNIEGEVIGILIAEMSSEFYAEVVTEDYIAKIIEKQKDLSKLPALEDATKLSLDLKNMVNNTILDYKNNGI